MKHRLAPAPEPVSKKRSRPVSDNCYTGARRCDNGTLRGLGQDGLLLKEQNCNSHPTSSLNIKPASPILIKPIVQLPMTHERCKPPPPPETPHTAQTQQLPGQAHDFVTSQVASLVDQEGPTKSNMQDPDNKPDVKLPAEWMLVWSRSKKRWYYFDKRTNASVWEWPPPTI